jgi:GTP cyclohydrolase I
VNPLEALPLEDVQSLPDHRQVPIDEVGISGLRYPILLTDGVTEPQRTIASVSMNVDLAEEVRGTHMSRFVEVLDAHAGAIGPATLPSVVTSLRDQLGSRHARISIRFPYFRERTAPVSGLGAAVDYDGYLGAEANGRGVELELGVRAPVTSLCPCSKEISDYGAHSQRGYVELSVRCSPELPPSLDELIDTAEAAASAPIRALLKRPDERYVTMQAYDKPAFVEDIARDIALALREDARLDAFAVQVTNQESIHTHDAVAVVRWRREA